MNAVEFLTSHRVVANRHARGAPLPHLTDNAIQSTLSELNKGVTYNSIQWRGRGGVMPTSSAVEFDRQLDKISIWLEKWSHPQTCLFLEEMLRHSSYTQIQLLHTVLQPSLHRDFMYTVRSRFPEIEFSPVSTFVTRELKDKLTRLRLDTFHRVGSAYIQKDDDVESVKLPLLLQESSRSTKSVPNAIAPWSASDPLSCRREIQSHREAKLSDRERWVDDGKVEKGNVSLSQDAVARFMEMPVRRHIQEEQMNKRKKLLAKSKSPKKGFKSLQSSSQSTPFTPRRNQKVRWSSSELDRDTTRSELDTERCNSSAAMSIVKFPEDGKQIMQWYTQDWNDTKRNEFLHKLLLKLDPRQHYFISSYLSMKQHKDIVGLLPEKLALKILKYLTPKELLVASKVSRTWERLANSNKLWKKKCKEVVLDVPVPSKPNWKNVFKDNLYLRLNWDKGLCRTVDFRGHTHSVLCVTCDSERLASGSTDKTIKVWDLRTGQLLHTLRGHSKGVWCLQFFTENLLVSGSFDTTIRVWNLRTGATTRTLLGHSGQIWCLKRYGPLIVSGSQDRTAKIWNIGRCMLLYTLYGHNAAVFAVDVADDGSLVITGSADRSVRLWSMDTGQAVKVVWVSPTTSVMSVSYSQGYFACSYDGTVCLYKGGKLVRTFNEHRKRVETVDLKIVDAEKGTGYIISAGKDGFIKYWDITKEESVQTFSGHNQPVNCVFVDLLRIVSASCDNKIKLWDFNIGMPAKEEEEIEEEEGDGEDVDDKSDC